MVKKMQQDLKKKDKKIKMSGDELKRARRRMFVKAEQQEGKCFYCQEELPEEEWTVEHLIRLCDGGHKVFHGNIVMACQECNNSRQNTPWKQWKLRMGKLNTENRNER